MTKLLLSLAVTAATFAYALPAELTELSRRTTSNFDRPYIYWEQKPEGPCFLTSHGGKLQQYPQYCKNGKCVKLDPHHVTDEMRNDRDLALYIEHVHHDTYDTARIHFTAHHTSCLEGTNAKAKCEIKYDIDDGSVIYDPTADQLYPIATNGGYIIGIIGWGTETGSGPNSFKCLTGNAGRMGELVSDDQKVLKKVNQMDFSGLGCNFYNRVPSNANIHKSG